MVWLTGTLSCARLQLSSIDNMRKDGKFMVGTDIPEGQGSVNALLAECFDHLHELRVEIDNEPESAAEEEHGGDEKVVPAAPPAVAQPPAATPVIESQS